MKNAILTIRIVVSFVAIGATNFVFADEGTPQGCLIAGPENAPVTIEEYVDFQCPYCSKGAHAIIEAIKYYPTQVKLVLRHRPLPFHENAMAAAQAVTAVCLQNPSTAAAFQKEIFKNQNQLGSGGEEFLLATAEKLGINRDQLEEDMKNNKVAEAIANDVKAAEVLGFNGTPSFRIGEESVVGARSAEEFRKIIDRQVTNKRPQVQSLKN